MKPFFLLSVRGCLMGRLQHEGIAFLVEQPCCVLLCPCACLSMEDRLCADHVHPLGQGNSPALLTGEQRGKYSSKQTLNQTGGKYGDHYRSQHDQES